MASSIPSITVGGSKVEDEEEDSSKLKSMKPHVPGMVIFADHNISLPWTSTYHAVVMFADISGFTALCEKYSTMEQAGIDQLTRTLNDYLSALVEGILASDGDILKFAGDAILAIWRVGREYELSVELEKVLSCCLEIQDKCGEWQTDIGVKLTVKIGVSIGEMSVTFLGNDEYRHYVELGPAVTDVNTAESFCKSGFVVVSPKARELLEDDKYNIDVLEDEKHARIVSLSEDVIKGGRRGSFSLDPEVLVRARGRRQSLGPGPLERQARERGMSLIAESDNLKKGVSLESLTVPAKKEMKGMVSKKMKINTGKLRKVVETVYGMKLDVALRLYILTPVLKKLDDGQPLEYLSEMRQVSIVFMNLVLDNSYNVEALLQEIFEIVYSKTKSMHGCLNKVFLFDKGCTFLVIFGLPGYKHEQDCAHALICSSRMKNILDKLDGVERVSIGVTTGTTFCGVVGHPKRHEYSVIGRKVNMAARLMMHYPAKVTCDDNTFQACRLPATYFEVLVTKKMKGLSNIGVIREFIEQNSDKMMATSVHHSEYPLLGRQHEAKLFWEQLTLLHDKGHENGHLVFSGAAGIGKTRLIDHLIGVAEKQKCKVISCAVEVADASCPDFLTFHIVRMLLSFAGLSPHIDKETIIMKNVDEELEQHLYLLNDLLGTKYEAPVSKSIGTVASAENRRKLLEIIVSVTAEEEKIRKRLDLETKFKIIEEVECLEHVSQTVVAVDDIQNVDIASWDFIELIGNLSPLLIVLTLRPNLVEKPPCKQTAFFIDNPRVKLIDLSGLHLNYMAPLACQLMDVMTIPKDLDRILRERSHGIPSWCLEILRDLLDKHQLLVVLDEAKHSKTGTISPKRTLIRPELNSLDLPSVSATAVLRVSASSLTADGSVQSFTEKEFLESIGYMHEQPLAHQLEANIFQDRIAVFDKKVDPKRIPIPDSMKEMVIARLDSMRSSDQLLIKCAAVLGMTFPLEILEMILPKALRHKVQLAMRRLMESGIFGCGSMRASRLALEKEENVGKYVCHCWVGMESMGGGPFFCLQPRFMNSLLQQTAYDVLLENQRIELHAKAAHYFEMKADEYRIHVPYYVLERPPPETLQEALQKIEDAYSRKKVKKSQIEDEMIANRGLTAGIRRGRRGGFQLEQHQAVPLVKSIVENVHPEDVSIEGCLEQLLQIYESICYHLRAAKETEKLQSFLLEAAAACVAVDRNTKALVMLKEAKDLVDKEKKTKTDEEKVTLAKIYRIEGKVLFRSGHTTEAYDYTRRAANLIGLKKPKSKTQSSLLRMQLFVQFYFLWQLHIKRRPASIRTLEQGYCLADLYWMDRDIGDPLSARTNALYQFVKVTGRAMHLHQFVNAYASLIESLREKKWNCICERLEEELLQSCAQRNDELSTYDRAILAQVYAQSSIASLTAGDLTKAQISGSTAIQIWEALQSYVFEKLLSPYIFEVFLQRSMFGDCVQVLQQLHLCAQVTGDRVARAWYYVLCMDLVIEGGCPSEAISNCIASSTIYMKTCDAVANEMIPRYYIAMTIALWYARKQEWDAVQRWFEYWEMYEVQSNNFMALIARARKVETMLCSMCECQRLGNKGAGTQMRNEIMVELQVLKEAVKSVPSIGPRYFHLLAYFMLLRGKKSTARRKVSKALQLCKAQANELEKEWIEENRKSWLAKSFPSECNDSWEKLTNSHILEWKIRFCNDSSRCMYTPPLANKT